jgi:hypothetical protein
MDFFKRAIGKCIRSSHEKKDMYREIYPRTIVKYFHKIGDEQVWDLHPPPAPSNITPAYA